MRAPRSRHKDQLIDGTSRKRIIGCSLHVIGSPALRELLQEFGAKQNQQSFLDVVAELRNRA